MAADGFPSPVTASRVAVTIKGERGTGQGAGTQLLLLLLLPLAESSSTQSLDGGTRAALESLLAPAPPRQGKRSKHATEHGREGKRGGIICFGDLKKSAAAVLTVWSTERGRVHLYHCTPARSTPANTIH